MGTPALPRFPLTGRVSAGYRLGPRPRPGYRRGPRPRPCSGPGPTPLARPLLRLRPAGWCRSRHPERAGGEGQRGDLGCGARPGRGSGVTGSRRLRRGRDAPQPLGRGAGGLGLVQPVLRGPQVGHRGDQVGEPAMARRVPHGLRGWWHYSHLVGWRITVLAAAVAGALGAGGVLPGRAGGWAAVTVVAGGLLLGLLAVGAGRAERARRYGCW